MTTSPDAARPARVAIGIDAGTTAVKVVAFSVEGAQVAASARTLALHFGDAGEVEADMDAIWDATAACLRETYAALGDAGIAAVGVTGQGDGLWLLDADLRPLGPAPTWMDARSGDRVVAWQADGRADAVLATAGTPAFSGATPVLYAERAEAAPDELRRAAHALYCKDWVRLNLTGEPATDPTEASRALLDIRAGAYSRPLAETLGVTGLLEILPPVLPSAAVAGRVTRAAAAATGLPEGTPVATGLLDVYACGLGLGAVEDGDGWLIVGTTACVGVLLASPDERRVADGMVMATGRGTQAVEFLVPTSSVPNLEWARRALGLDHLPHEQTEALAACAGPGAGGVAYLPYGAPLGERAPFLDPHASASWLGMGYGTTPGQALRAVYEGIAFALAECVDALRLDGDIVVSGGGARSSLLCQILADALRRPVIRLEIAESGALGAAITALVASGDVPDERAALDRFRPVRATFQPDAATGEVYASGRALLADARDALRPVWPRLRRHRTIAGSHAGPHTRSDA